MKKILIGWLAVSLAILVIGGSGLSMNDEPVSDYLLPFGLTSALVLVTMVGVRFFLNRPTAIWALTFGSAFGFALALFSGEAVIALAVFGCLVECIAVICGIALWKIAQPNAEA